MRAAATPGRRSSRHAVRRVVDLRPAGVIYYAEDGASDGLRLFGRLEGQTQRAASSDGLLLLPTLLTLLGCELCWLIRCMKDACKMKRAMGTMHGRQQKAGNVHSHEARALLCGREVLQKSPRAAR